MGPSLQQLSQQLTKGRNIFDVFFFFFINNAAYQSIIRRGVNKYSIPIRIFLYAPSRCKNHRSKSNGRILIYNCRLPTIYYAVAQFSDTCNSTLRYGIFWEPHGDGNERRQIRNSGDR